MKAASVAQPIELPIGAQQRFLGYILGIGGIAQDTASHSIGQRGAFGEPLLELAPRVSMGCIMLQLIPDGATWLDQNQLLHLSSRASFQRSPSPYT